MDTPRDDRGSEDETTETDDTERSVIDDAGVNNDEENDELEDTE